MKVNDKIAELVESVEQVPWRDKKATAAFLAQTYYYSRHTTRVLALAGSRFDFDNHNVHQRFIRHCAEEMNHERLADRDLASLGYSLKDFPEFPSTRAFYQTHYHTIEHVSPWSIFGYIVALEGLAVAKGEWLYNEIRQHHGEKAASFMKVHAADDIEHVKEAEKILASLPPGEMKNVEQHLETTCFLYRAMLGEVAACASKGQKIVTFDRHERKKAV